MSCNMCLQNPAEKVADVARDVLKAGGQTLVAGAMIPARQIGKVFRLVLPINYLDNWRMIMQAPLGDLFLEAAKPNKSML